jgi:uracil-DNA glycosylase family 4
MTSSSGRSRTRLAKAVAQRLESLHRAGVTHVRRPKVGAADPSASAAAVCAKAAAPAKPTRPAVAPSGASAGDERCAALAALAHEVAQCARCAELASTRTQTVFGTGNPRPRLVFMGEAPGADEDRQGLPFVGRAGQLLTDMIEKGMRLPRSEVYILNAIKCRPPGNRTPTDEETSHCREYFQRQLEILQPEFICCLGAVASHVLLEVTTSVGQLRGRVHDYQGIHVICTYHPAYLLRNPPAKKQTWEDLQLLMREMGLPSPAK